MTFTEDLAQNPEYTQRINTAVLQNGQQEMVDPEARLGEEDIQRMRTLGIEGNPVAYIGAGRQEFAIVDVRQSHMHGNIYQPFSNEARVSRDRSPITYELDPEYPLVLVHLDQTGGMVGRAIRPGRPIVIGREASQIDGKSSRFRYAHDDTLSREHLSITLDTERGIVVKDLNSTNGTKLRYGEKGQGLEIPNIVVKPAQNMEETPFQGRESRATSELMRMGEFFPQKRVIIEDKEFFLSKIVHGPDRTYAVMYTTIEKNGERLVVPRFLYRSNSDGGWRVGYGIDSRGRFIKEADEDEFHYTQETKLDRRILDQLDISEIMWDKGGRLADSLKRVFATRNGLVDETDSRAEVSYYHDPEVDAKLKLLRHFSAGEMSSKQLDAIKRAGYEDFSHYLQSMDRVFESLPGFMPDFRNYLGAEIREHTMLGRITVEHFAARIGNESIVWSMASDAEGRVWVDNIKLKNSGVTSYGTAACVFDGGIVTSKPVEYAKQSDGLKDMQERVPYKGRYEDITLALDHLLPIREYRKARGIVRAKR